MIEARGRNGRFKVASIEIDNSICYYTREPTIRVEFYSKNIAQTRTPPVILNMPYDDAIDFCEEILNTIDNLRAEMLKAAKIPRR